MKKSKNYLRIILSFIIVLTSGFGMSLNAQKEKVLEKIEVPLSKSGTPVNLKVKLMNNDLDITGYNGKIILVEVIDVDTIEKIKYKKQREKTKKRLEKIMNERKLERKNEKKNDKAKGMYKISNPGIGLSIEEENNKVEIVNNSFSTEDLLLIRIKVPFRTSVKISLMNGCTVKINGLIGDHVVNHKNGSIDMKNISGSVIANTLNGEVKVAFNKISLNKPMAFSTFNGDVDITLPANAKFKFKLKTNHGEIYSDYKLTVNNRDQKSRKTVERSDSGKYRVNFDNTVYALLNGGGEEIFCKTWRGNIYIRKKK